MRLDRLVLKGVSKKFPGVVDLPFRDLPPGLVAVVGPNGEGKTVVMEATPGLIHRQLPSRDDCDPIDYVASRDAFIEEDFTFEGRGTFRARLNMDGVKRKSEAVLKQVYPDGTEIPLNDGKVSTYDAAMRQLFPSPQLFINSAFGAQGRGDEFTASGGSQRKDLFIEFLALKQLLAKAKAASASADLCSDARLRLQVQIEGLERDTHAQFFAQLDRYAQELLQRGDTATRRQRELVTQIADLEDRVAMGQDQAGAFAAANLRLRTLETELESRQHDRDRFRQARGRAEGSAEADLVALVKRRDAAVEDLQQRIAGNKQIQAQAVEIRAATAALVTIDAQLTDAREKETADQARRDVLTHDLTDAERALSAFIAPKQELERSKKDAGLLSSVPCGGSGDYAACQFLLNATAAAGRIESLERQLAGMTAAVERRAAIMGEATAVDARLRTIRATVADLVRHRAGHEAVAKYEKPLVEAETRLTELQGKVDEAQQTATRETEAVAARLKVRVTELDAETATLQDAIDRLEREASAARADLAVVSEGHERAAQLQSELTAARLERDTVTTTLAQVQSGRDELERRRQELTAKQARLEDVRQRLARVETELLEWQSLAKALGKGGLPDLEIDAAGPTISALTNSLLEPCYGPEFSVELVTQTEKADGGMKDECTVRVFDNEAGAWRDDIAYLSGGQRVVVQEALMCAIAIYVNERSPMPIRTLWRDETGAALDPANAIRYVQMLRQVQKIGGFHHVFFVSHNPDSYALADAQILVNHGTAVISLPPFDRVEAA